MFKSTKYPIHIIEFPQLNSTNIYCKSVANKEPKSEMVVLAHYQSHGKGQFGNLWDSEAAKNLTFSILYHPSKLDSMHFFQLNMAVSLGVNAAIEKYVENTLPSRMTDLQSSLKVKWPNDIYFNSYKIGGILIENCIQANQIEQSIIGIGLNLNQTQYHENTKNANSLKSLFKHDIDREYMFDLLIEHIFKLLPLSMHELSNQYISKLYGFQKLAIYTQNNTSFVGKITSIDKDGRLVMDIISESQTQEQKFFHKEIEFTHKFLD